MRPEFASFFGKIVSKAIKSVSSDGAAVLSLLRRYHALFRQDDAWSSNEAVVGRGSGVVHEGASITVGQGVRHSTVTRFPASTSKTPV